MDELLPEEEFRARLDTLRGRRFPLLSHGGITLIDAMCSERRVVDAARTTSEIASKGDKEDRNLIRYLMRHRHTTPQEFPTICWLIECPMDLWRQWIRHRTACLTSDTVLQFDLPGGIDRRGNQLYPLTISQVWEKFQPTCGEQGNPLFKRDRVQQMQLRCVNEATKEITHTQIVDIWQTGVKPVYRVELTNGSAVKMSADHLCLTDAGWKRLKDFCNLPDSENPSWLSVNRIAAITRRTGVPIPVFNEIDEETEEWRAIPGWVGYYEASNQGRVRRIAGGQGTRPNRCKALTVSQGRVVVSLNKPGRQETMLVHRAVLSAFVGQAPPDTECCHTDDNKLNNALDNLRWGTSQDNKEDSIRNGRTTPNVCDFLSIESVTYVGKQMTYDLEVAGPFHNFSADGMIVHNSVNEFSSRYSKVPDINDTTEPDKWRLQSTGNRQGSSGSFIGPEDWPTGYALTGAAHAGQHLTDQEAALHRLQREVYDERMRFCVANEQARKDLCLSQYTRAYWQNDLHNTLHFLGLRMDKHAQLEIRLFANKMGEILQQLYPVTWQAFLDYRLNAITLTSLDQQTIQNLQASSYINLDYMPKPDEIITQPAGSKRLKTKPFTVAMFMACVPDVWRNLKNCRERDESLAKLQQLGIVGSE